MNLPPAAPSAFDLLDLLDEDPNAAADLPPVGTRARGLFEKAKADRLAACTAAERLRKGAFGDAAELDALCSDPGLLHDALVGIAGIDPAKFVRFSAYSEPLGSPQLAERMAAERGLPTLDPADLREQAIALSLVQGKPASLKHACAQIEKAIVSGDAPAVRAIVESDPLALWAMDFSLREYEAENLLLFAAKHAPDGPDVEICKILLDAGVSPPSLLRAGRFERTWHSDIFEGIRAKSVESMMACMQTFGWTLGAAEAAAMLSYATDEDTAPEHGRGPDGSPPPPGAASAPIVQKILMLDWIAASGVDLRAPLLESDLEALAQSSNPMAARFASLSLAEAAAGRPLPSPLDACAGPGAPERTKDSWALLAPALARWGADLEALESLASRSGHARTSARIRAAAIPLLEADLLSANPATARKPGFPAL